MSHLTTREIEKLEDRLTNVRNLANEYLQQRNTARQDLLTFSEAYRSNDMEKINEILKRVDISRGIGGYEWPVQKVGP